MDEKLKCKICGFECMSLITHLKYKHQLSTHAYKEKYGDCVLYIHSPELRNKISLGMAKYYGVQANRDKMSDIQSNGASCLTKKYWINKGFSEDVAIQKIKELQKNNSDKSMEMGNFRYRSILCKEYWMSKGKTELEAIELIRAHQEYASSKSSKFKGHVRSDESKLRIAKTLEQRYKSHGYKNYNGTSKIEQDFFNYIKCNINENVQANVRVDRFIVDILVENKVIEFYGDFWHCNPLFYKSTDHVKFCLPSLFIVGDKWKKDQNRIDRIKQVGYNVLVIWENDWKKNKEECILQIKQFLS